MSTPELIIFATHPVQYHAPVYQALQKLRPDAFAVWYGSDFSARGFTDREFGQTVAWDTPLLEGYRSRIVGQLQAGGLSGPLSLRGQHIHRQLRKSGARAVLLTSLRYHYDMCAYLAARRLRLPIFLKNETQDEAWARSRWKRFLRVCSYYLLYAGITGYYPVGQLNAAHYRQHLLRSRHQQTALLGVPDRWKNMTLSAKDANRQAWRQQHGLPPDRWVVGFSGKLIPKKNPDLLVAALARLQAMHATETAPSLVFLGAGEREHALREASQRVGLDAHFLGFVSQHDLRNAYLGLDVLVLPSNRAGETWGLVVNEALHAGCAVAVSDAVGCAVEFAHLERFEVFPTGDVSGLTNALKRLRRFPRDYDWAAPTMQRYSIEAAAEAIHQMWPPDFAQ